MLSVTLLLPERVHEQSYAMLSLSLGDRNVVDLMTHKRQGDSKIAHGSASVTMCDHQFGEADTLLQP
jgi:hypothetical protein